MAEGQVTDRRAAQYQLARPPFVVIATQNPIDHRRHVSRCPRAQMDRFMMMLKIGYPGRQAEHEIRAIVGDAISRMSAARHAGR